MPKTELSQEAREAALQAEIDDLRRRLDEQSGSKLDPNDPMAHAKRPSSRFLLLAGVVCVVLLALAFTAGLLPRLNRQNRVAGEARTESEELPVVVVVPAKRAPNVSELSLPSSIQAVTEAPVLARASGYLKKLHADIGDRVKAGQLLAEIEAPELDQDVRQAQAMVEQSRAAVEQAKAAHQQGRVNEDLARVTAERWSRLQSRGVVSKQENDQYQAQFQSQSANVNVLDRARAAAEKNLEAAEANLQRLTQVQSYKQVRAPFAGVISLRNVDSGALITDGQTLLFRVAQSDTLRAYINVPQAEASAVKTGEEARVELSQYPGRTFSGTVVRASSALDPSSRTLLAEVRLPNREGLLLPGMYANVTLRQQQRAPSVLVSGDALIVGPKGTQVATVGKGNRVHFKNVVVGRDNGREVEILQGVEEGDLLIENPNDRVQEGVAVRPEREKVRRGSK